MAKTARKLKIKKTNKNKFTFFFLLFWVLISLGLIIFSNYLNSSKVANKTEAAQRRNSLKNMKDVLIFLEGKDGAEWITGDPKTEITYFPWKSPKSWGIFRNMKSVGTKSYHVILLSNSTNTKFTLIGVETINKKTTLDFVSPDNKSKSIALDKQFSIKEILGDQYDKLWDKYISTWSDLSYPKGDCPSSFIQAPTSGVTEGFACTKDNKRGHYFQAQSKLRK